MKKQLVNNLKLVVCAVAFVMLSTTLFAQPNIPDISGVKNLKLNLACKVTLIQGNKASITITGDEDALGDIQTKLRGDMFEIYNDSHHQHKNDVLITITMPDLKKLSIGGVVDINTPNQLSFDDFKIEVSGVAELDIKLNSKILNLDASGVLSGKIVGETKDLNIEISGVGKIDASEFKSQNCEVEVSGVAKASVYATEKLDASVSGMGRISYLGNPIINKNASGFGSISRL